MKLISFFYIALCLFSCFKSENGTATIKDMPDFFIEYEGEKIGFELIVIDSCEYIGHISSSSPTSLDFFAHKGNCRFCANRNLR